MAEPHGSGDQGLPAPLGRDYVGPGRRGCGDAAARGRVAVLTAGGTSAPDPFVRLRRRPLCRRPRAGRPGGRGCGAANDTVEGAVALDFGDTITLDTTEATTDAVDKAYFEDCKPPAADATVWYTFTSDTRTGVDIDPFESSYSVGMLVTTGTPGDDLDTVLCGGGRFTAEAGVDYTIVLFDDQRDDKNKFNEEKGKRTNGGTLQLSVNDSPPVPHADLTVDEDALLNADGSVTVSGTYWCTEAEWVNVFGGLDQTSRGTKVTGFAETEGDGICDGTVQEWTLTVAAGGGDLQGGDGREPWFALGCIDEGAYCSGHVVELRLRVRAAS